MVEWWRITTIAGTGRGDVHVGNEQLCIIHSDANGQFFDVVDSGLQVKLTELWREKPSKPPPVPRRRSCRTRV